MSKLRELGVQTPCSNSGDFPCEITNTSQKRVFLRENVFQICKHYSNTMHSLITSKSIMCHWTCIIYVDCLTETFIPLVDWSFEVTVGNVCFSHSKSLNTSHSRNVCAPKPILKHIFLLLIFFLFFFFWFMPFYYAHFHNSLILPRYTPFIKYSTAYIQS